MTMVRLRGLLAIAALALFGLTAAPVQAGQAELELLSSYVGNWSGAGVMVGGEAPETFKCRMTVAKGNQAKINYSGRCSLVNMNLSVSGTIGFDDAIKRYQAAMSSNAGYTGLAIGKIDGEQIACNLSEKQTDRGGNVVRIGSKILLVNDKITVDFEIEFNNSGQVLTASVPFAR